MVLPAMLTASGSYSSLDRWVFQGDRLEAQVIHRPLTGLVSTLKCLTAFSAPVILSWSSVVMEIGDGNVPYMLTPALLRVLYSYCVTRNSVLPVMPATLGLDKEIRELPSGQSE